jgi:hypothetical protein
MTWLKFAIPFGVSFVQGFIREYTAPGAPSEQQFTIVDSGTACGWQWVAVPKSQARAFKAAHPYFSHIINFLKVVQKMQRRQPADFRIIRPLVGQVCEAVEEHDGPCELFIRNLNA